MKRLPVFYKSGDILFVCAPNSNVFMPVRALNPSPFVVTEESGNPQTYASLATRDYIKIPAHPGRVNAYLIRAIAIFDVYRSAGAGNLGVRLMLNGTTIIASSGAFSNTSYLTKQISVDHSASPLTLPFTATSGGSDDIDLYYYTSTIGTYITVKCRQFWVEYIERV